MGETMVLLIALLFGVLAGGVLAWLVLNGLGTRRLQALEGRWKALHRKTERQRDDLDQKLLDSSRELAKAERDLLAQARKSEEAMRLARQEELRVRELEEELKEERATRESQKAVIALMKSQLKQAKSVSAAPEVETKAEEAIGPETIGADDLKQIRGIGPSFEKRLHRLGITRFKQIAQWDAEKVQEIALHLGIPYRRIEHDDWVVGAKYRLISKKGVEV